MVSIVTVVSRAPPSQAQAALLVRGDEGQLIEAEAEGQRAPGHGLTLPHVKGVESRHLIILLMNIEVNVDLYLVRQWDSVVDVSPVMDSDCGVIL